VEIKELEMTTWTIPMTEYTNDDNKGIFIAHWRATATETVGDDTFSASSYGTCGFTPDPDSEDFVPFESLTEADVLAWVYESVDKDAIEAGLTAQIEEQKAPQTVAGVPW